MQDPTRSSTCLGSGVRRGSLEVGRNVVVGLSYVLLNSETSSLELLKLDTYPLCKRNENCHGYCFSLSTGWTGETKGMMKKFEEKLVVTRSHGFRKGTRKNRCLEGFSSSTLVSFILSCFYSVSECRDDVGSFFQR